MVCDRSCTARALAVRSANRAMLARISSAVFVQTKGFGLSRAACSPAFAVRPARAASAAAVGASERLTLRLLIDAEDRRAGPRFVIQAKRCRTKRPRHLHTGTGVTSRRSTTACCRWFSDSAGMPRLGRPRPSAKPGTGCCRPMSPVRSSTRRSTRRGRPRALLSDDHFTVDGTLLEAWASLKSFHRKNAGPTPPPDDPGNPTVNFHGETRKNDTQASTTHPDAQLYRKGQGKEAKLAYRGHVLLDTPTRLVANVCAGPSSDESRARDDPVALQETGN